MSTYGWETSSSVMRMSTPASPVASGAAMSSAVRYWLLTEPLSSTCTAHKAAELGGRACGLCMQHALRQAPRKRPSLCTLTSTHDRRRTSAAWSKAEETYVLRETGAKASRDEVRLTSSRTTGLAGSKMQELTARHGAYHPSSTPAAPSTCSRDRAW